MWVGCAVSQCNVQCNGQQEEFAAKRCEICLFTFLLCTRLHRRCRVPANHHLTSDHKCTTRRIPGQNLPLYLRTHLPSAFWRFMKRCRIFFSLPCQFAGLCCCTPYIPIEVPLRSIVLLQILLCDVLRAKSVGMCAFGVQDNSWASTPPHITTSIIILIPILLSCSSFGRSVPHSSSCGQRTLEVCLESNSIPINFMV